MLTLTAVFVSASAAVLRRTLRWMRPCAKKCLVGMLVFTLATGTVAPAFAGGPKLGGFGGAGRGLGGGMGAMAGGNRASLGSGGGARALGGGNRGLLGGGGSGGGGIILAGGGRKPNLNKPNVNKPPAPKPPAPKPPAPKPPAPKPPAPKPPAPKPPAPKPPAPKPPVNKPPVNKPPVNKPPVNKPTVNKPTVTMPPTLLSRTQVKAFSDQVQVGAEQAYNSLVNELGVGMSQNPLVAAQLSAIKQKLDNGQAVSQDDINNLKAATKASGLPTSASNNVLQQTGGQLVGLSQANAMLQQSNANGPGSANPSGQMSVMTIPSLAAGIQMLLPNGGLVLGTGGKGEFGVVSANAADLFDEPQGVAEMPADYAPAVASRPTPTNLQATAAPSDDGLAESQSSSTDYDHVIAPMGNQTFAFTIDNGDNNEVFYYTVDAEQQEVPARVRQVHTSHHPLLVRFDRGDGSTAEMRIQTKGEILKVAVDRTDGLWNLDTASTFTPSVVAKSSSDTSAETATANQPAKAPSSIQVSKIGEFLAKLNAADRE